MPGNLPRPIHDFFIDRDGVEYICEIYVAMDGIVEDAGLYPLLEDGSKGPSVDTQPFDEEIQEHYSDYLDEPFE